MPDKAMSGYVWRRLLQCQPNRVNRHKRLWKQSSGALLFYFTFSL